MRDAFLAAISDHPDDDLPRLVYADWLDENGEPDRAEFIRVQVELARQPANDPRRIELKSRERSLLREHRGEWSLPEFHGRSQVFRRGFIERVNVSADWLLEHQQALTAPGPLRSMRVYNASAYVGQLAEYAGLARLETLDLTNTLFTGPDDVRNFFTNARLGNLRELVIRNSNFWEGEELSALADTPVAARLKSLDVSGNRLSDAGARVLATRPEFGGLDVLTFRADELEPFSCVHAHGAGYLADSTTLTNLRSLDLGDHYIGDAGVRSLVESPNAITLERLGVEYNEIGEVGDSGILAIVESPRLVNLRQLRLGGNRLSPLGAEALASWPHLERMTLVDLQESPLSPVVRAVLANSRWADRFVM